MTDRVVKTTVGSFVLEDLSSVRDLISVFAAYPLRFALDQNRRADAFRTWLRSRDTAVAIYLSEESELSFVRKHLQRMWLFLYRICCRFTGFCLYC